MIVASPGWAVSQSVNHPLLRHLTDKQGLSQNTINHFYEDNQGFIWIATEAGLNRFDGESLITPTSTDGKLGATSVNSLIQDSNNNLWISTNHGLNYISHDQSIGHHSHFPSQQKYQVKANMLVGSDEIDPDNAWIFSWNGVYRYKLTGRDISQPDSMTVFHSLQNNLLCFEKDAGQFWLGSTQGLYLFTPDDLSLTKITIFAPSPENKPYTNLVINSITKLIGNQLIISTDKGLFLLDTSRISDVKIQQVAEGYISNVSADNNLVYFSNLDEIKTFDPASHQVNTLFSLSKVLPKHSSYKIKTIFVDSNHFLWIGTYSQGAFIWDTKDFTFESWGKEHRLSNLRLNHDIVWSIDQDHQGNFWVGTEAGLNYFDLKANKIDSIFDAETPGATVENLKIYDLIETIEFLWLASGDGLIKYNRRNKTFSSFRPKFKQQIPFVIYSLLSPQPGFIWMATNIGVLKFDSKQQTFSYDKHITSQINAKSARLLKYHNNLLWIGLHDKLITYSIEKKQTNTILQSAKNANGNYALLMDIKWVNGKLWASYKKDGIYVLDLENDNKIIKHLHSSNGFSDNTIYSLQNSHGYLWASSTQGLIRINPENYNFIVFDHSDGLVSNEFNEGAALQSKEGYFLYGGPRGLTKIDPAKLKKSNRKSPVKITSIEVISKQGNHKPPFGKIRRIILDNHQDKINISYSTLDFVSAEDWQYEYWLTGTKQTEPTKTKHPQVLLSDFPAGETIFNIRSIRTRAAAPSEISQLSITVTDSPMFTVPTAMGNYIIIILIISWFTYQRQQTKKKSQALYRQIEEKEKRMELALFDDRRGIWDCLIDQDNIEKSSFIVYQNKREPIHLTLEKYFSMVHPEDVVHAKQAWIDFSSGKQSAFLETYRSFFYQHWVWNRIYGKVNEYYSSGHPKRATGIWTDINPEKKIEDKLNLYSHAFQSTQDIVFILDNDLTVVVVNQAYENATGFPCDALIGQSMVDIAFSRFTEKETEQIKNQVQQTKRWHGESSVPRRNASSFAVSIRINIISKDNKNSGYVVVMSDISQIKRLDKPAYETSFYDQTTGLPNKVLAFDRLRQLLKLCKNHKQGLSIIFLSIDHFRKLKTAFKDDIIDALIARVSSRLLPYIQKDDVLARYEQDTFIIILRHALNDDNILHTVNQLLKEISKTFIISEHSINISACAGISSYPDDGGNWSELITKSETALAQTRQQGENLFKYYHEDSNKKALERVGIENRLNHAIEAGELFLVYQPLLKLDTLKTIELDVNLRWRMEDNRIIYPSQFLPIAEEIGSLETIGNWLISQLFNSLNRWNQEGIKIYINVNLPVDYLLYKNTLNFIRERLSAYRIDPADIFIAIHENSIKNNIEELVEVMTELKSFGIRLVLDGFGKSSASLQNLQKFQFHSIKLDRSLIRNISKNKFNDRVLQGIISLINDLKLGSVAKGIETKEQLEFLCKYQCNYGQGFLFSDPLIESQMRQYLLEHR